MRTLGTKLEAERNARIKAEEEVSLTEKEKTMIKMELQDAASRHHLEVAKRDNIISGVSKMCWQSML